MKQIIRSPIIYIFLLGLFLRFYSLGNNPAGFFRDEAAKGYNAYCLLKTGQDIDGYSWPIFTRELATFNSAFYSYLIIPFIVLFGLTETAVRFPAALAGSLTILSTYWLVKQTFDKRTAVISTFLLAVCPWHLVFSRWANQGILLPLFITLALGSFVKYIQNENKRYWLFLSFSFFGISLYTYDIEKLFLVFLWLGLFFIYQKELFSNPKRVRTFLISILLFLIISSPLLAYQLTHIKGMSRFTRISIFNLPGTPDKILQIFFKDWLAHYSPAFLFLTGDANIRHSMLHTGQLYLFEFPLILIGIYALGRIHKNSDVLLLYWLFIFPIPSSLTYEGIPHALRAICALPIFSILSAVGLIKTIDYFKIEFGSLKQIKQWIFALFLFLSLFNIGFCLTEHFLQYPAASAQAFQYGMKEAVDYAESVKGKYEKIVVFPSLGFPEIFFLFYTRHIPASGHRELSSYEFNPSRSDVRRYLYTRDKKYLFLVTPDYLYEFPVKKIISGPNGRSLLLFVENDASR